MFENPRRGRQARNFGKNVPKILDLKSSSEEIFSENCRWVPRRDGRRFRRLGFSCTERFSGKVQCTQSLPLKYYCTLASSKGVSIMALDVEAAAPAINTRLQQYITN